jgi:hypothetical protein
MATLVQIFKEWEPAAAFGSAVFTAVAALAAAVGAWEARRSAKEAQATRLQSAEPYLRVLIGAPNFKFSWRPNTGEPPRMIEALTVPMPSHPSIVIANFGGGPALDLRVRISAVEDNLDVLAPLEFVDPGAAKGGRLAIHTDRFEASAPNTAGGVSPILSEQFDFEPACGSDETTTIFLREALAARLLALAMAHEQQCRDLSSDPARIRWNVHIAFQTALKKKITYDQAVYATCGLIQQSGEDRETGAWLEKHYWFTLAVEPPPDFHITPNRVVPVELPPTPLIVSVDNGFRP